MDTVVIPYFLALATTAENANWTSHVPDFGPDYGPVYAYVIDVNFTRSPEKDLPADYSLNLASTLRCRPMNATVLSCSLENRRMALFDFKRNARFERIQSGKELFVINFNSRGVESLRVSSASSPKGDKRYGLIKTIASQLNVGADFAKRTSSLAFTDKEISTFGECETLFDVSSSPCELNDTRKDLRLRSLFYELLGDSIVLRKKRDVRKCDRPARLSLIENDESVVPTVTSSVSEMRLCRTAFESSTIVEGKAVTVNEDAQASVFRQIVKLRLENVASAEEVLPIFDADTAIDTIYLHKDIDNNELDT